MKFTVEVGKNWVRSCKFKHFHQLLGFSKPVQTGCRPSVQVGLGTFATWVVQVGGAYATCSKFMGLLSAMYRYFAYICLKLKEILVWVRILEGQYLFLHLMLDISFSNAEYLEIQDYFVVAECLLDHINISTIVEVAQNSLCWIFFHL